MPIVKTSNLALQGVDLTSDPISIENGALILAQNAQTSPDGAATALRKRDGMTKLNSVAAAGSILTILDITLS